MPISTTGSVKLIEAVTERLMVRLSVSDADGLMVSRSRPSLRRWNRQQDRRAILSRLWFCEAVGYD
ncbi:MAG: hypothetical protein EA339_01760 [Rhodobacteraceae bacterium]|nr:MAG: hypothetical protein EA339_01760 [Paracoccaceae bacterium]